jgi:hypothetical protein
MVCRHILSALQCRRIWIIGRGQPERKPEIGRLFDFFIRLKLGDDGGGKMGE